MTPLRPEPYDDSVDEVPLASLPSYGDPERTEQIGEPEARDLYPVLDDWLGDEAPSLANQLEPTNAMSEPIWDRTDPELDHAGIEHERVMRFLVLSVLVGVAVGAGSVVTAAMLGGLL